MITGHKTVRQCSGHFQSDPDQKNGQLKETPETYSSSFFNGQDEEHVRPSASEFSLYSLRRSHQWPCKNTQEGNKAFKSGPSSSHRRWLSSLCSTEKNCQWMYLDDWLIEFNVVSLSHMQPPSRAVSLERFHCSYLFPCRYINMDYIIDFSIITKILLQEVKH